MCVDAGFDVARLVAHAISTGCPALVISDYARDWAICYCTGRPGNFLVAAELFCKSAKSVTQKSKYISTFSYQRCELRPIVYNLPPFRTAHSQWALPNLRPLDPVSRITVRFCVTCRYAVCGAAIWMWFFISTSLDHLLFYLSDRRNAWLMRISHSLGRVRKIQTWSSRCRPCMGYSCRNRACNRRY